MHPFSFNYNQPMQPNHHSLSNYNHPTNTSANFFQQYSRKPYENQEFLDKAFNYKDQYIQAFKTLPHEIKLKFYLSLEEVKMLGYMNDRQGYQQILKQIARRVMLMGKGGFQEQRPEKQNQTVVWGSQLQNLCDTHLKKMQNDDLLDDIPMVSAPVTPRNQNPLETIDFLSYQDTQQKNANQNIYGQNNFIQQQPLENNANSMHSNQIQEQDEQFQWAEDNNQAKTQNDPSVFISQQNNIAQVQQQESLGSIPLQVLTSPRSNVAVASTLRTINNGGQTKQEEQDEWEWDGNEGGEQNNNQSIPANDYQPYSNQYSQHLPNNKPQPPSQSNSVFQSSNNVYQSVKQELSREPVIDIWDLDINEAVQQSKKQIVELFHDNRQKPQEPPSPNLIQMSQIHGPPSPKRASFIRKTVSQMHINNNHNNQLQKKDSGSDNDRNLSVKSNVEHQDDLDSEQHDVKFIVGGFSNHNAPSRTTSGPSQNFSQRSDQYYSSNFDFSNNQDTLFTAFSKNNIQSEQFNAEQANLDVVNENEEADDKQNNGYVNISEGGLDMNDDEDDFEWEQKKNEEEFSQPQHQLQPSYTQYRQESATFNDQFIRSSSNREQSNNFQTQQLNSPIEQPKYHYTPDDSAASQIYDLELFNLGSQPVSFSPKKQSNISESEPEIPSQATIFFTQNDLTFLNQYRCHVKTDEINKALKKKYFDFDRQFYAEAEQLIQGLGYRNSEDFKFIQKQKETCLEIFRLAELKSSAVEQFEEHLVLEAITKSKRLYRQLDSQRTAEIIKKYLGMKGQSKLIKIAKLSIQANVPKELITKYIKEQNAEQILTAQYCIENMSSTRNVGIFAGQVAQYLQQQFNIMNRLSQELAQLPENVRKQIRGLQKFKTYREHLVRVVRICRNFLLVGKICLIDEQFINILNQQITQILPNQLIQNTLLPQNYVDFYSGFACDPTANIYSLFSKFRQFMETHPICALCLQKVTEPQNGTKYEQSSEKYYHFQCWNLEKDIRRFKLDQLKPVTSQRQFRQETNSQKNQQKEENEMITEKIEQRGPMEHQKEVEKEEEDMVWS